MFGALVGQNSNTKHIWPALAVFLPVLIFLCPSDTLVHPCFGSYGHIYQQRLGLIKNVFAVIRTPFTETTFTRSFIADIFCSMPKIFNDLEYTVCIYVTGSFWDKPNEWVRGSGIVKNGALKKMMRFVTLQINNARIHGYYTCGGGIV